jgi:hypothetical protein
MDLEGFQKDLEERVRRRHTDDMDLEGFQKDLEERVRRRHTDNTDLKGFQKDVGTQITQIFKDFIFSGGTPPRTKSHLWCDSARARGIEAEPLA